MKAVVFKGIGEISLEDVKDPVIEHPQDVIVKITTSAICGTDLHLIRGTLTGVKAGTILGHEGVGVVEKIGDKVHSLKIGDRVIIPSTIGCGSCEYCNRGIFSQCDNANPHGSHVGTVFFGGPLSSGPLQGLQAEKARIPFADASLIKVPHSLTDEQVILLSDILPTSYMAVDMAEIKLDDTVAIFGCGPVGQLAIACLKKLQVKTIFAIDHIPSRLAIAKKQGAHIINFDKTDPVEELKKLTNNKGPTKVIDAVGIDAQQPLSSGPIEFFKNIFKKDSFKEELKEIAPQTNPHDGNWYPGNGPSQVLRWAVEVIAKAGTFSIIGVYPPSIHYFPIGQAFNKNLTIRMGNCNHRKYLPLLVDWVVNGELDLLPFITQKLPFSEVITGYKHFDKREDGWLKVILSM